MRKDFDPPQNRHLQLVSSDGHPHLPRPGPEWASDDGPAPLLRQVAVEGQHGVWRGWRLGLVGLGILALGYGVLHLGAAQLRSSSGASFDARRFSVAVSVRSRLEPSSVVPLGPQATVHVDDAWSFVLHNRSHQNAFFGLFAVSAEGQFFWFYPRDGGGVDLATLPLPAIPTITLPDGVTPEALPPGPLDVMAVFLPKAVQLSELEAAYTRSGSEGLRRQFAADVQTLRVSVVGP